MSRAMSHAFRAMDSPTFARWPGRLAREGFVEGALLASAMMRAIMRATSDGWCPVAVSCESITASEPSNTAVATSLASARVGRVAVTIDWSISVATMTGRWWTRARPRISRWMMGTRSGESSTPRSPRATITASDARMICSR
jgi:hypothetical protein